MRKPLITLLTDFGTHDPYVAVMKGVISSICPNAQTVDISHEVRPYEITQGAYLLAQAFRYFPPKTIHVAVVDPGVGTARRPILVECAGQYFIGPDNGVLAMVYTSQAHKAREITAEKYFLHPVSRTFHGRDIFAPSAAHLGLGVRPSQFGKRIDNHLKLSFYEPQRTSKRAWTGTLLHIDRFGNLVTNFHMDAFDRIRTTSFELTIGPRRVDRLVETYAESEPGELVAIVGSTGYLEISANQGSAQASTGCGVGAPCDLTFFA